jgi:pyruvate/oxaloacetate carboxyltransferase
MAPFNYVEAIKLGANTLHTAIPPLANGSSQPSIFNVASNAQALGYEPLVNLDAISQSKSISPSSLNAKAIPSVRRENTITRNIFIKYPAG